MPLRIYVCLRWSMVRKCCAYTSYSRKETIVKWGANQCRFNSFFSGCRGRVRGCFALGHTFFWHFPSPSEKKMKQSISYLHATPAQKARKLSKPTLFRVFCVAKKKMIYTRTPTPLCELGKYFLWLRGQAHLFRDTSSSSNPKGDWVLWPEKSAHSSGAYK